MTQKSGGLPRPVLHIRIWGVSNDDLGHIHNAKFGSLEDVLDHYSSGIIESPSLDPSLKNGIPLTENEKTALIAFLKTLTDKEFTQDERFFKG